MKINGGTRQAASNLWIYRKKIEKDSNYSKFEQNTERMENHSLFTPDTNNEWITIRYFNPIGMANGKPFVIYNWHEWRANNHSLFQRDMNGEWKIIFSLHMHAKPSFAHRLQTGKMASSRTSAQINGPRARKMVLGFKIIALGWNVF